PVGYPTRLRATQLGWPLLGGIPELLGRECGRCSARSGPRGGLLGGCWVPAAGSGAAVGWLVGPCVGVNTQPAARKPHPPMTTHPQRRKRRRNRNRSGAPVVTWQPPGTDLTITSPSPADGEIIEGEIVDGAVEALG